LFDPKHRTRRFRPSSFGRFVSVEKGVPHETLDRLDLVLDRLGAAVDPLRTCL
jgi:hypothetical protein